MCDQEVLEFKNLLLSFSLHKGKLQSGVWLQEGRGEQS